MGLVTFTSDGRMMSVLVDGRASLPEGTPRQYSSYCGNYTFDGSTLTTVVDANCDPVRFTAPQIRKVRFEGERWRARAPEPVQPGEEVRITAVHGLTLEVTKVDEAHREE